MTIDIKDFVLNNDMALYQYVQIALDVIPEDIVTQYNLRDLAVDGYVYAEIQKGMYGLPQAGRIASDALIPHLTSHGYNQSKRTLGLFTHTTRPIAFCLIVDDFGVKYVGKHHAEHLLNTLTSGTHYCGITLKWDYDKGTVTLTMPGYVERACWRVMPT
jgi:hypothetical protein